MVDRRGWRAACAGLPGRRRAPVRAHAGRRDPRRRRRPGPDDALRRLRTRQAALATGPTSRCCAGSAAFSYRSTTTCSSPSAVRRTAGQLAAERQGRRRGQPVPLLPAHRRRPGAVGVTTVYFNGGRVSRRTTSGLRRSRAWPGSSSPRFRSWRSCVRVRLGGAIDTCSRSSPSTAPRAGPSRLRLRHTGLGVGASRFAANVMLDLLSGSRPSGPPWSCSLRPAPSRRSRPFRGHSAHPGVAARATRRGAAQLWLRTLDRLGWGSTPKPRRSVTLATPVPSPRFFSPSREVVTERSPAHETISSSTVLMAGSWPGSLAGLSGGLPGVPDEGGECQRRRCGNGRRGRRCSAIMTRSPGATCAPLRRRPGRGNGSRGGCRLYLDYSRTLTDETMRLLSSWPRSPVCRAPGPMFRASTSTSPRTAPVHVAAHARG